MVEEREQQVEQHEQAIQQNYYKHQNYNQMRNTIKKFEQFTIKNTNSIKGGANGRGTRTATGTTANSQSTKLL